MDAAVSRRRDRSGESGSGVLGWSVDSGAGHRERQIVRIRLSPGVGGWPAAHAERGTSEPGVSPRWQPRVTVIGTIPGRLDTRSEVTSHTAWFAILRRAR